VAIVPWRNQKGSFFLLFSDRGRGDGEELPLREGLCRDEVIVFIVMAVVVVRARSGKKRRREMNLSSHHTHCTTTTE